MLAVRRSRWIPRSPDGGSRHAVLATVLLAGLLALPAPAARPDQPTVSLDGRFGFLAGRGGFGYLAGLDAAYWFHPSFAVGASIEGTLGVANSESDCHYDHHCLSRYLAFGPTLEAHALPRFPVDPWIRAGVGAAIVGGNDQASTPTLVAFDGHADLGVDVRVWHLFAGPYATGILFSAKNPASLGFGGRLGAWF